MVYLIVFALFNIPVTIDFFVRYGLNIESDMTMATMITSRAIYSTLTIILIVYHPYFYRGITKPLPREELYHELKAEHREYVIRLYIAFKRGEEPTLADIHYPLHIFALTYLKI